LLALYDETLSNRYCTLFDSTQSQGNAESSEAIAATAAVTTNVALAMTRFLQALTMIGENFQSSLYKLAYD
jgi:type VII secretion effector (TIGR04197 family)